MSALVVMDTDHMSLLQRGGPEGQRIFSRLKQVPPDDVATTVVSFEEQARGWLKRLARFTSVERTVEDYAELKGLLADYCNIAVIAFDSRASDEFERLRRMKLKLGTMDLRIAAIALANGATVLTRNTGDFSKVPGLRCEDWSA